MRWLCLRSPDPRARQRALAELRARDAIRAAEEIVSAEWINTLEITTTRNAVTLELLERERRAYADAERRRSRDAERDRRRLTVLIRTGPAIHAEGGSAGTRNTQDSHRGADQP